MRIAAIAVLVAACTEPPPVKLDPLDPYAHGDDDIVYGPDQPQPDPYLIDATADYSLTAHLTITAEVSDNLLDNYFDAPGATLIAAAQVGSVTALSTLEAAMPGVTPKLANWYDAELRKNALTMLTVWAMGYSFRQVPDTAVLEGAMTIDGAAVRYSFDTLQFDYTSTDPLPTYPLGGVDGEVIEGAATATFVPTSTGGQITFKQQGDNVVIAIGDYAYRDTEAPGAKQTIKTATGCPFVALAVANSCGGPCNAYLPQLVAVCEQGIDEMFAEARRKLDAVKFYVAGGSGGMSELAIDGSLTVGKSGPASHAGATFSTVRLTNPTTSKTPR